MKRILTLFLILALTTSSFAEEKKEPAKEKKQTETVGDFKYEKLDFWDTFLDVPDTSWTFLKEAFGPGTFWPWMGIIGSTALLYVYDQEILDEVQRFGRRTGIGNDNNLKTYISVGDLAIFRGPSDFGSALYFLGDGWTHSAFVASFAIYGQANDSPRAFNTGLQIMHGMMVSTLFSQFLKRTTGRESPFVRSVDRGAWNPFPSFKTYTEERSKHDAFPSGHVMTAMVTFTVITENYPEHAYWVRPIQYAWVTLLALQMINNGVHWASDYPLGIAMGYLTGKIVARRGRFDLNKKSENTVFFTPMLRDDAIGVQALYRF